MCCVGSIHVLYSLYPLVPVPFVLRPSSTTHVTDQSIAYFALEVTLLYTIPPSRYAFHFFGVLDINIKLQVQDQPSRQRQSVCHIAITSNHTSTFLHIPKKNMSSDPWGSPRP